MLLMDIALYLIMGILRLLLAHGLIAGISILMLHSVLNVLIMFLIAIK